MRLLDDLFGFASIGERSAAENNDTMLLITVPLSDTSHSLPESRIGRSGLSRTSSKAPTK